VQHVSRSADRLISHVMALILRPRRGDEAEARWIAASGRAANVSDWHEVRGIKMRLLTV
jgi:hypothetical protein